VPDLWHTFQRSIIFLLRTQIFQQTFHPPARTPRLNIAYYSGWFVHTVAMFVSTDEEAISELQAFEGSTQGKKSRDTLLTAPCPGFEPDRIEL
jgi:hypothetical protein